MTSSLTTRRTFLGASVGALALAGLAAAAGRGEAGAREQDRDLKLPSFDRLALLAGAFAAAGGALALLASQLPALQMPPGLSDPSTYPCLLYTSPSPRD